MNNIDRGTQKKLLDDPNAIESIIMVNPEPLGEMTATLPENFPDSLIPKEKCEYQMIELINCLVQNGFDNVKCENFQFTYYHCKKFRDSVLFSAIKNWDCKNYSQLNNEEERKLYFEKLLISKAKMLKTYEETNINPQTKGFRKRLDSDIQQLNWRLKNLQKCNVKI